VLRHGGHQDRLGQIHEALAEPTGHRGGPFGEVHVLVQERLRQVHLSIGNGVSPLDDPLAAQPGVGFDLSIAKSTQKHGERPRLEGLRRVKAMATALKATGHRLDLERYQAPVQGREDPPDGASEAHPPRSPTHGLVEAEAPDRRWRNLRQKGSGIASFDGLVHPHVLPVVTHVRGVDSVRAAEPLQRGRRLPVPVERRLQAWTAHRLDRVLLTGPQSSHVNDEPTGRSKARPLCSLREGGFLQPDAKTRFEVAQRALDEGGG